MTITHVDRSLTMHTISLNVDRWSLIVNHEDTVFDLNAVLALSDDISYANADDDDSLSFLDVLDHTARSTWRVS
jgi:hypothetical protein